LRKKRRRKKTRIKISSVSPFLVILLESYENWLKDTKFIDLTLIQLFSKNGLNAVSLTDSGSTFRDLQEVNQLVFSNSSLVVLRDTKVEDVSSY
jgi:hypothetical protein